MSRPSESSDVAEGPMLIHRLLSDAGRHASHQTAVRDPSGSVTWAELDVFSRKLACWLKARGVGKGSVVACLLPHDRFFAAAMFGTVRLGAIFAPIHPMASPYLVRAIVEDATPSLMLVEDASPAWMGQRSLATAALRQMEAEINQCPSDGADATIDPRDLGLLLYTSGTTSQPKGVACPHESVVFAAQSIASRLRYSSSDVIYVRLPLSFDVGLYQLLLAAIAGCQVVLPGPTLEIAALAELRRCGATVVPTVPTLADLLVRLAARDPAPTSLRLMTNTGAALTTALANQLRLRFPTTQMVSMYGTTECKRITIALPDEHLTRPGTVGTAIPGTRILIVDDEGRPLRAGQVGQVVAIGPHVMAGYWRAPHLTEERFRAAPGPTSGERAVFTGDYGYTDEDGRLFLVGRRDDQFKRRGQRTSSQEIEAAMLDVPGVEAAAAIVPEADEVLTALFVGTASPADVLRGIADRLGSAKVPDECFAVLAFKTTLNGKIDRSALRAMAKERRR